MRYVKHTETKQEKAKIVPREKNVVIETRYGQEKISLVLPWGTTCTLANNKSPVRA